ncbi:hypothetical protein [Lyngbya confervoides]|uniref:Uncharacterized protein n=1 Tax=Lyngbya confervoides BDU141951 TaxID=1574623 RepID=A0ABD4SX14_9CYAN|nr:hypothetical protein [Lyngbya confervoides]MCM1981257.1 hypothetical protein [Lyngbya confervoides BDU141951]
MDYIYYVGKASLVLRVVHYLQVCESLSIRFMTVLHLFNGWVVRVHALDWPVGCQHNFQAFLGELGVPHQPNSRVALVLRELEEGHRPTDIMQRHRVAIVSHGPPNSHEIEVFRDQFIEGLGYCPETLA